MFPSQRPKNMTDEQVENAVMDMLMDGAGTEREVADETGLSMEITRRVLRNLDKRGLVEPLILRDGRAMWDMKRTRKP